jgi:hypothetical protein
MQQQPAGKDPTMTRELIHDGIDTNPHSEDCDSGWYDLMCPECQHAADATRCRHCAGTGTYSDEVMSCACPYCGATGEATSIEESCAA